MSNKILYISIDGKYDGPSPSVNSMVNFAMIGTTRYRDDQDESDDKHTKKEVFRYQCNILRDIHKVEEFWNPQSEAWSVIKKNVITPQQAMCDVANLLYPWREKGYEFKWMGYPIASDWMFFKSYYELYKPLHIQREKPFEPCINSLTGKLSNTLDCVCITSPDSSTNVSYKVPPDIGHEVICISTMFWIYCQQNRVKNEDKDKVFEKLQDGVVLDHNPLNDALAQENVFWNLMKLMKLSTELSD